LTLPIPRPIVARPTVLRQQAICGDVGPRTAVR